MFWIKSKDERALLKDQRKECIQEMLTNEFPLKIYLASFVCNILFSLAAIGFQVAADKLKAPNFFVYAG